MEKIADRFLLFSKAFLLPTVEYNDDDFTVKNGKEIGILLKLIEETKCGEW